MSISRLQESVPPVRAGTPSEQIAGGEQQPPRHLSALPLAACRPGPVSGGPARLAAQHQHLSAQAEIVHAPTDPARLVVKQQAPPPPGWGGWPGTWRTGLTGCSTISTIQPWLNYLANSAHFCSSVSPFKVVHISLSIYQTPPHLPSLRTLLYPLVRWSFFTSSSFTNYFWMRVDSVYIT